MKRIILMLIAMFFLTLSSWSQTLSLKYRCGETNPVTSQIKPYFNLINTGSETIDLEDVSIRYYFTSEGTGDDEATVEYAIIGSSTIQLTLYPSQHYLDVSFFHATLSPGMETGEIQIRINKSNWSVYDQTNDISFDPSATEYSLNSKLDLYYKKSEIPSSPYSLTLQSRSGLVYYHVLPEDVIYDQNKTITLNYNKPTEVTVTAHSLEPTDYRCEFVQWTGDFSSSTEEITLYVDGQYQILAEYNCYSTFPTPTPTPINVFTPPPVVLSPLVYEIAFPETSGQFTIETSYGPLRPLSPPEWIIFGSDLNFTINWDLFTPGESKSARLAFHDFLSNGIGYANIIADYENFSPTPDIPWPVKFQPSPKTPIFSSLSNSLVLGYLVANESPVVGVDVQWSLSVSDGLSAQSGTITTGADGAVKITIDVLIDGCINRTDTMMISFKGNQEYAPIEASVPVRFYSSCEAEARLYFSPQEVQVQPDEAFSVNLAIETNAPIAAYGLTFMYNSELLEVDYTLGSSGVEAMGDGYMAATNTLTPGEIVVTGFDANGTNSGSLDFLKIYFRSLSVSGNSQLKIQVNNLVDLEIADISSSVEPGSVIISSWQKGDVNSDHKIDIVDALLCAQCYVNPDIENFSLSAGDVDCDGSVTIIDALLIAQYYVGIINSLC